MTDALWIIRSPASFLMYYLHSSIGFFCSPSDTLPIYNAVTKNHQKPKHFLMPPTWALRSSNGLSGKLQHRAGRLMITCISWACRHVFPSWSFTSLCRFLSSLASHSRQLALCCLPYLQTRSATWQVLFSSLQTTLASLIHLLWLQHHTRVY